MARLRPSDVPGVMLGIVDEADYRERQAKELARTTRRPTIVTVRPPVVEEDGVLKVRCVQIVARGRVCNNYPIVDPNWKIACCFECGAVYERLVIPPEEPR